MKLNPKKYVKFRNQDSYVTSNGHLFLKRNEETEKFEIRKYVGDTYSVLKSGYSRQSMLKKMIKLNEKNKRKELENVRNPV